MGKTGVINRDFIGEENNVYHDVIQLFKIYRAVNWRMQIKVNQVKHRIREEYGTDLDEFLDSIYQAGMDINQDLDDMKQRIEVINRSNKFLKLIDEAVELMRNFHPQGERYYWVLGKTAVSTLKDRARIKGTALMDVKKSVLADILNECLQVAKGDALLRISEGKVRGVLSGDEADYAIISMPKLFMVASAYISGDRNGEFIYGYADHNMAQITWKIVDQKMTKAYADLMEEHGKKPFGNLQTFIRIVSSDVGASGANIFYSILDGDFTIVLGEALRTKHRHKQGLEEFSENMESIFQYYKQKLRDIGKLCDIRIRYPVNALSEVMKKQSFGKKLIAETVERFKTNFGEQPCSAYEIYCGLCEALFFARKSGSSPSNLVKMEEKIARCMNVRWHDYDIPGEISL